MNNFKVSFKILEISENFLEMDINISVKSSDESGLINLIIKSGNFAPNMTCVNKGEQNSFNDTNYKNEEKTIVTESNLLTKIKTLNSTNSIPITKILQSNLKIQDDITSTSFSSIVSPSAGLAITPFYTTAKIKMFNKTTKNSNNFSQCPRKFEFFDNKCYFVSNERVTWHSANRICKKINASLVEYKSINDYKSFSNYLNNSGEFKEIWVIKI